MSSSRTGVDVAADPVGADIVVAHVESLSHDGRGVARIDGKATFIDGALTGKHVRARVLQRHRRYDTAALVEVLTPSPDRRVPPCPHFGVCGGCSRQYFAPQAQFRAKQTILAEQLARIGKVAPERWLAPLTGPEWGYRRRARLGVRVIENNGGVAIGFRERQRSHIADIDSCLVLDPVVASWLPALHVLVQSLSRPDQVPQIEVAVGEHARALVVRYFMPLTPDDEYKLRAFGEQQAAHIYVQSGESETATALWPTPPVPLDYRLPDGSTLQFRPTDFIQVNAAINDKMIEQALALLDPQPDDVVLDLFAGLGNFTLPLARRAGRVLGIEGDNALVEGARHNARANGFDNIEFRVADLFQTPALPAWHGVAFDKLLLDPPRSGAIDAIKQLSEPLPEKIVYVSCYPATLARDGEHLVHRLGYRLSAAGVMDMFPHTSHVESMALFERTQ